VASYACFGQQEVRPTPGTAGIGTRSLSNDLDIEAESLGVAAEHLMAAFRVPGGVVTVEGCSAPPARSFRLQRGTTLNEALDVLVREFGGRVTMGPGFFDIWSDTGTSPLLLATRIQSLRWHRGARADSVFGELLNSTELSVRAGELGLERAPGFGGPVVINMGPHQEPPGADEPLRIEDATLLDALNSLALSKGKVVWEYVEHVCGSRRTWTVNLLVR